MASTNPFAQYTPNPTASMTPLLNAATPPTSTAQSAQPAPMVTPSAPAPVATATPQATPDNVASVAQPVQNTARPISQKETVAGQLNDLLKQNGTYMQSAKANADQQMAGRGLLSSSLAVGASQKAAIDSAMPIATQDANTYANAGMSAQEANQQQRLTGYTSLLNSAQNKENFGYQKDLNDQNIDANVKLQNDKIAAEERQQQAELGSKSALQTQQLQANKDLQTTLKQMDVDIDLQRLTAQQQNAMTAAITPIQQQYIAALQQIEGTPDSQLSPLAKQTYIRNITEQYHIQVSTMAKLYGVDLKWPDELPAPGSGESQPGRTSQPPDDRSGVVNPRSGTTTPPPQDSAPTETNGGRVRR